MKFLLGIYNISSSTEILLLNIWRLKIRYWTMKEHRPIKHNIHAIFHSSNKTRLYITMSQVAQYIGMINIKSS